jgi:hypothetical protein
MDEAYGSLLHTVEEQHSSPLDIQPISNLVPVDFISFPTLLAHIIPEKNGREM